MTFRAAGASFSSDVFMSLPCFFSLFCSSRVFAVNNKVLQVKAIFSKLMSLIISFLQSFIDLRFSYKLLTNFF